MAKQIGVRAGQQYVQAHSPRNPPPVWEVRSIYSGVGSIAHAGLMNPADPLDRKTVSFSALLDEKHYRLLRDVGADPIEQDTSRGAMQTKAEPMLPSSKPASIFFLGSYVAGRLHDKGDLDGYAVWKRILRAVGKLLRVGPKVGERVN